MRASIVIISLACLSLLACDGGKDNGGKDSGGKDKAEKVELKKVEVTKEGSKFDPPVEVSQLPGGVWYCDMGTVHYAQGEQGDGKCPVCGMDLKPTIQ